MVPLPRRALTGLTALAAAAVMATVGPMAAAGADGGGDGHRAEARILDGVPLPPGAEATRLEEGAREYVVTTDGTQVLAWFRTALPNAGWTERSAAQASAPTSTADTTGPDGARSATADAAPPQRLRAVFTRSDARLTIVVLDPPAPDTQLPASTDSASDTSELRVRVRSR